MKKADQQRAAERQFCSEQTILKILYQGCPDKAMPDTDADEIPSTLQAA